MTFILFLFLITGFSNAFRQVFVHHLEEQLNHFRVEMLAGLVQDIGTHQFKRPL